MPTETQPVQHIPQAWWQVTHEYQPGRPGFVKVWMDGAKGCAASLSGHACQLPEDHPIHNAPRCADCGFFVDECECAFINDHPEFLEVSDVG